MQSSGMNGFVPATPPWWAPMGAYPPSQPYGNFFPGYNGEDQMRTDLKGGRQPLKHSSKKQTTA